MEERTKHTLLSAAPCAMSAGASLAGLTTFGLGGDACILAQPNSMEELCALMRLIAGEDVPWFVLGGGSNVLFRDGGFPGVVIRLGDNFSGLNIRRGEDDDVFIDAGASLPTPKLLSAARREGLSGLEFLAGIPGWLGGAVFMNAGTAEGSLADVVTDIEIVRPDGEPETIRRVDLRPEYRSMNLPAGAIVAQATFKVRRGDKQAVEASVKRLLENRGASQPRGFKSAGCIFKNPEGDYAGRLIERAGLKNRNVGPAVVSEKHANFIVHDGRATAAQVIELIELVRAEVNRCFKINLELEIKVVGKDK